MKNTVEQFISYKQIGWLFLIFISLLAGVLSIYVNPVFIIAALIGLVNIVLVFKYPMWGLICYIIVFLTRPGELYPSLAALRPELIVGVMVIVAVILHQKLILGKVAIPNDRLSIAMVAILVAMSLSIFTSYEKTETYNMIIRFFKLIIFYYLIISLVDTKKRFVTFIITFLVVVTYIALDAFKIYLSGGFVHTMDVDRLTGSTSAAGDPNSLGATLVTTIPLIIVSAAYFKNKIAKLILSGLAIFMVMLMVITASRSGLLSFFGIIMAGIYFSRHKILNFSLVILLCLFGWVIMPQQYKDRYMKFSELDEDIDEVSSGRWEIWQSGIKMIPKNPIFGVGAGAFAWANASGEYGRAQWMQSHNLYIEIVATMGVIGLIAWGMFIIFFLKRLKWLIKLRETEESYWIILFSKSFMVIIVALLISGMFGHNLYRYTWYMLAGLSLALTGIYKNISKSEKTEDGLA